MPRDANELSLKDIQEQYALPDAIVSPQVLRRLQRDPRAGARKLCQLLQRRMEEQNNETRRVESMLHFERVLWKAGIAHVAGVDEVGIGPLAGPVVAAAVVFPPQTALAGVRDSKLLDALTRDRLDVEIRRTASGIGIGVVEIDEIDRINVYHAGLRAMQRAVGALPMTPQHVLVDSRTIPDLQMPQNSFDKGDGINFSIAAASIVAKVYRDRLMTEMEAIYPGYGFAEHKGYATPFHQAAIRKLGPCAIHRKSFDYIRELCGLYSGTYYELKEQAAKVSNRKALLALEQKVRSAKRQLTAMERKKIQMTVRRLWRRM